MHIHMLICSYLILEMYFRYAAYIKYTIHHEGGKEYKRRSKGGTRIIRGLSRVVFGFEKIGSDYFNFLEEIGLDR
jgi:Holliday junction resolvasome RuvABC ATP-dependent DNA helicase subunit